MTENVLILPVWKKDSTAEEWFYELALLARTHPDRFTKMVLIYEQMAADGHSTLNDCYSHGVNTTELFGLIEIGKQKLWESVRK